MNDLNNSKTGKRALAFITGLMLMLSMMTLLPEKARKAVGGEIETEAVTVLQHTQAEAVQWAKDRVAEGWNVDVDGLYGCQCVDLTNAYFMWLQGKAINKANWYSGNAYEYVTKTPPDGFERVYSNPQPGDVFIMNQTQAGNTSGHVGIVIGVQGNELITAESNFYYSYYQNRNTRSRPDSKTNSHLYTSKVTCYFRPNFKPSGPDGHVMSESEAAGWTIPDGDYQIVSEYSQNYYVDVQGYADAAEPGTNVQMFIDENLPNPCDMFHVQYLGNRFYRITQYNNPNLSLDVSGASQYKDANIQMWTTNDSYAQQWSIEPTDGRGYKLRARCSGLCMDVHGGIVELRTNVSQWTSNDSSAQYFSFVPYKPEAPIPDGEYYIRNFAKNDIYLNAEGQPSSYYEGTNVNVSSEDRDKFEVKYIAKGFYSIKVAGTELSLDINMSKNTNHTADFSNVQLINYEPTKNKQFVLVDNGNGSYRICPQAGGLPLDISGGVPISGRNVAQYHYYPYSDEYAAQSWVFEPVGLKGDVNGDGKINMKDYTLLQRYLNGWNAAIVRYNSEVTGDGKINMKDLTALQRYLNGWNVKLG